MLELNRLLRIFDLIDKKGQTKKSAPMSFAPERLEGYERLALGGRGPKTPVAREVEYWMEDYIANYERNFSWSTRQGMRESAAPRLNVGASFGNQ